MPLLELHNIVKRFPVRRGFFGRAREFVHAVNGVTLSVDKGETLGVVGESGCGKTTLGRIAVRLIKPTGGKVIFDGADVTTAPKNALAGFRRRVQIIFQDPFSSLNPRMSVCDIVAEPMIVNPPSPPFTKGGRGGLKDHVAELLESVGLKPEAANRYPHEFSGGQRQRICIARAIALEPELIVADEPVSSLDVAVQADILRLFKKLQHQYGIAYLFVSHDLRIVASMCNRVVVMYLGKVVEEFPASMIRDTSHPYTIALVSAVPVADPAERKTRIVLQGDAPSLVGMPTGCPFHPRCQYKEDVCERVAPVLEDKGSGHFVACHFPEKTRRLV